MGRRLRQQWRTRSIDRFDDLDPFLFFNITRSPTSNTANGLTITLPCTTPNIVSKFPILVQFLPLFVFYSFDYTVKSGGVCNRLPDLAYYPVSLALALPSYVSDMVEMSHGLRSSGSTFMYLYHLISIDLESSRSFNTHTLHCYKKYIPTKSRPYSALNYLILLLKTL